MTLVSLFLTAAIWALAFVVARSMALQYDPRILAIGRFAVAALMFLPVLLTEHSRSLGPRILANGWRIVFLGITGVTLYNLCFFWGVHYAPALDGGLISPVLNPLVTALLAGPLFGERLGRRGWAGAALALLGECLLFYDALTMTSADTRLFGDFLFACGALCWSAHSLMLRRLGNDFKPAELAALSAWVGLLFLVPFGIGAKGWVAAAQDPALWLQILFLAGAGTVLAFFWYARAVVRLGAARSGLVLNLIPVLTLLFAILILGERPSGMQWAGTALVMSGIMLVTLAKAPAALGKDISKSY